MSGLKQRRRQSGKRPSNESTSLTSSINRHDATTEQNTSLCTARATSSRQDRRRPMAKWKVAVLLLVYIPAVSVVNPTTIARLYYTVTHKPCEGICHVPPSIDDDGNDGICGPVDANRLVFLRIPKTASTTIRSIAERLGRTAKSVARVDIGELEDVLPSLPRRGVPVTQRGYHDPTPRVTRQRIRNYYTDAIRKIAHPPYVGQDRTLFDGHFYHFHFPLDSLNWLPPQPKWLQQYTPTFLRRWYNYERPTQDELQHNTHVITMIRRPQDRLSSMYYYNRHGARADWWREEFVRSHGNATLEECLVNATCVEINDLRRFCSLQVEMLCGLPFVVAVPQRTGRRQPPCVRPANGESLEIAKRNVRDEILFAGVTERMDESLLLLSRLLPTYFEGVDDMVKNDAVPREKVTMMGESASRRETTFSKEAQMVLDDICSLDNRLYEYVEKLLAERVNRCLR